ncbi:MAG: thioredoxin-dependent peroxiredoxin [Thermodesulfobacteriota bacterium]|nr:thioredoxin-dependent peroxiredoxin [Thermodesulfobacteriota bacterium]
MVKIGDKAPDFKAQAFIKGEFKDITLSEYKGKWVVLFFYPGDFTFVCPTELTSIAIRYKEIQKLDAEIFALSVDSVFVHKMWQQNELSKMIERGVPYPMLSDPGGKIGRMFGVYDEDLGIDLRGRFIIDPDGVLQSMEVVSLSVGRSVEELLRQIEAFSHVRKKEGSELCPANWAPGKEIIMNDTDFAGEVCRIWKP